MLKRSVALATTVAAVASALAAAPASATFPGQNGQIAYTLVQVDQRAKGKVKVKPGALSTIFADGSGSTALPSDPAYNDIEPAWSPDGTRLVYVSSAGGKYDGIYLDRPEAPDAQLIARARFADTPAWSPDGQSIVYTDWDKGIMSVPADGSAAPRVFLANPRGWELVGPSYASNGSVIVFGRQKATASAKKYRSEVWAMDPSGANPRRIVAHASSHRFPNLPDVSPDSTQIVFEASTTKGASALFTAALDGSEPRVATTSAKNYLSAPTWSPDGTKLAATLYKPEGQGSSLVTVDVATGQVATVRRSAKALLINPSWQPIPVLPTVG